jgi:hypothetical protein
MRSTTVLSGGLALAMLACTSEPTGPDTPGNPSPAAPSLVLASNTWTLKAPMPGYWSAGVSAGVAPDPAGRSIVYAFGGQDDQGGTDFGIRAYDVATNTWTGKAQITHGTRFNGVGRIGSRLYFSGGFHFHDEGSLTGYQAELYAYDPAGDSLIRKRDMPQYTADGVTGVIGGKLYVLPGTCSPETDLPPSCQNSPIRLLYRYDPATNAWTKLAPSPHFHRNGARGVINGKFYVAGGRNVAALDRYDPATNTWRILAPVPMAGPLIGAALGGKLYVIGWPGGVIRAYAYNPGTNTWQVRAAPKWDHDALVQVTLDGRPHLLAVGGVHGPYINGIIPIPNDTELYTP